MRGVTAEWRTSFPNCCARLRRAGFRKVALIIEPNRPGDQTPDPDTSLDAEWTQTASSPDRPGSILDYGETVPVFYGKFTADCLTVVTIVIFNSGTVLSDRRARPVLFFLPCDRAFACPVHN